VAADGSGALLILAVHVVGDGAAEGDEFRPGGDRKEPAARHAHAQQRIERQAGFRAHHAGLPIGGEEMIRARRVEQIAAAVECHVAIRPAQAAAQQRPRAGRPDRGRHLVPEGRGHDRVRARLQTPPRVDLLLFAGISIHRHPIPGIYIAHGA
jgi:hypothetical protein